MAHALTKAQVFHSKKILFSMNHITRQLQENGFSIAENVFTDTQIKTVLAEIDRQRADNFNFRKSSDLFAIRCFLQEMPAVRELIFTESFRALLSAVHPQARLTKSIYFNKPPQANWIVNWHQDLTILVKNKAETEGFAHWTTKGDYYSVQPPIAYSHQTLTFRIHLDNCDAGNGALRVIPGSHQEIRDSKALPSDFFDSETVCEVLQGGVLLMKPLIWHSSRRTSNARNRRVIHLEFCNMELPQGLLWQEQ